MYGAFPAKDGNLVIAAQVDDAWNRLAKLIGGEALAADERFMKPAARNAHHAEAMEIVRAWTLAQPSRNACLEALDKAGVPSAPVQTIDEVVKDPQIQARGMLVEQEHPALGKVTLPEPAVPLLGLRHDDPQAGAAARPGQPPHRGVARVFQGAADRRDGA